MVTGSWMFDIGAALFIGLLAGIALMEAYWDSGGGDEDRREKSLSRKREIIVRSVEAMREDTTPGILWEKIKRVVHSIENEEAPRNKIGVLVISLNLSKLTGTAPFLTYEAARDLPGIIKEIESGDILLMDLLPPGRQDIALGDIKKAWQFVLENYGIVR